MRIEGSQHFGFSCGFHRPADGVHCCHRKIAHSDDQTIQLQERKYMMYLCILLGFKSLIKRTATPSFGMAKDMIPGMNAMLFHLIALDVAAISR